MFRMLLIRLASVLATVTVALLFCEVALRLLPIPGIQYNVSRYSDLTGFGLYPNSTLLYRNGRGDKAKRSINSIGYADKEHQNEKQDGTIRIGFFGDSYTEARQVELDATFFRLIENRLRKFDVETLAFGVSGFSTLQSYITHKQWEEHFDLDLAVYVFVENDPGDNVPELKEYASIPYPVLTGRGITVDIAFRAANRHKQRIMFIIGDYLTSKSLVLSTISDRSRLLLQHGIRFRVTEDDRTMATKSEDALAESWTPKSDDSPSTWPNELRERATRVTEAVLIQWSQEARDNSGDFVVLYVPRAREMSKPTEQQDSWKHWLEGFCAAHDIVLVDSSPELLQAESSGQEVFYDHFTEDGHSAFADSFVNWFQEDYIRKKL